MKLLLIALLCAISYAQTEGTPSVDTQALKMAEEEGISVDLSGVKQANKDWNSAQKAQKKNINKFVKSEKITLAKAADVLKGAKTLDLAEDTKNVEDNKIEGESINYIAAEVVKNKKKIDKAIQERDALIEKYVPDIKKLGLEAEKALNARGQKAYQEHKKDLASQRAIIDQTKQETKKKLEAKKLEIEKQKEISKQEFDKAQEEGDKTLKSIQKEMEGDADKTKHLMKKEIDTQRDKEVRYRERLKELHQQSQKIDEEYKSAVKTMQDKLESDIKAVDMKYAKEKQHKMDKAQKEQAEFQKQFDTLTKEIHELQKHAVRADADLQMEKAKLGKEFQIERQKSREAQEKRLKDIHSRMQEEKKDALAKQEADFKRKEEVEKSVQQKRIVTMDEARKRQENRDQKSSDSLKKRQVKQQKATDDTTTKWNKILNLISQLRNRYSTKLRVRTPRIFRRKRRSRRSRRRSRRSRRKFSGRRGRSRSKYGEELFLEDSSELEIAAQFEDEDEFLELLIEPLGVFLVLWNICALGMFYEEWRTAKRLEVDSELTAPILSIEDA